MFPSEIEILHRGLSRKLHKASYSKLRHYNKIESSRLQQIVSEYHNLGSYRSHANECALPNAEDADWDDEFESEEIVRQCNEINQINRRKRSEIDSLRAENQTLAKEINKQLRLSKLIDPKIKKLVISKSLDLSRQGEHSWALQNQLMEILLELEVTRLEDILSAKRASYQRLGEKAKNKEVKLFKDIVYETKAQFLSCVAAEHETKIESLEMKIKEMKEKCKEVQNLVSQKKKSNKEVGGKLVDLEYLLKQRVRQNQERRKMMKSNKSEEFMETKGGELKNSQCLQQEIESAHEKYEQVERGLRELMECKMREKIELCREIQLYGRFLKGKKEVE